MFPLLKINRRSKTVIERVNPQHPDKLADRIAGAIVDLAYTKNDNPKVAVEALLGHGVCDVIVETSEVLNHEDIKAIVHRIAGNDVDVIVRTYPQDTHLANNQKGEIRCGDNGIFKGMPPTEEEKTLSKIAREINEEYPYDGKYILDEKTKKLIICQSNIKPEDEEKLKERYSTRGYDVVVNPLGSWTGGIDVDTGAVNRKLGSDMGRGVTGGGINGKDIRSKADVACNIWAAVKAMEYNKPVELYCAIGDTEVTGRIGHKKVKIPYKEIADFAKSYVDGLGGCEALSEWGLL